AIISLVGGKWTTFRGFAEEVADTVLERFKRKRVQSTRNLAIGGGKDYPTDEKSRREWVANQSKLSGLSAERVETLLRRYGTTAAQIIALEKLRGSDLLPDCDTISRAEIAWVSRNEFVVHLADIVLRRT